MRADSSIRVWPLLAVVTVLFVLSVRAPREWRRVAVATLDDLVGTPLNADLLAEAFIEPLVPWSAELERGLPEMMAAAGHLELAPRMLEISKHAAAAGPPAAHDRPHQAHADAPAPEVVEAAITDELQQWEVLAGAPRQGEIGPVVARRYVDPASGREATASVSDDKLAAVFDPSSGRSRVADEDLQPADRSAGVAGLQRQVSGWSGKSITRWPYPAELASQFDRLSEAAPQHAPWCQDVLGELLTLSGFDTLSAQAVGEALANLNRLAADGQSFAEQTIEAQLRDDLARSVHGLRRRLRVWQGIYELAAAKDVPVAVTISDSLHLQQVVAETEAKLRNVKHRDAWQEYLQIAAARQLCQASADTARTRTVARQILRRMGYASLTPEQRDFLQQPEFLAYSQELKHLAAEPVDYFRLLQELEDFETAATAERASWIAAAQQDLRWSHDEPVVRLGQELDAHYRNANVRLAVSASLINRLVPSAEPLEQPIDERIQGIRTRGCAETITKLRVSMIPSPNSWQVRLRAEGRVASRTYASQGPATFFTRGLAKFEAGKKLILHPGGVRDESAEVVTDSRTGLAGLATAVDAIPIVGDLVQVIAQRQYESRVPAAEWEAENRMAWRIGETIDEQSQEAIERVRVQFATHFYGPMQQLQLDPVPLEMRTTDQRVIARYRLAGHHQLAAHTPRPLAPGDSVLSVQVHESALNNVIEQLGWNGRRVSLQEVYEELGALFALPQIQTPADLPDDVMLRFADRNPLRLSFRDGRATLTLGLSELSQGRNRWRNFVVRVHYQPSPEDPQADLVRDQYVELMGRLAFRDQLALRGIFSRVFSREKPIDAISRRLAEDPRLAGLTLRQLEINDGWLAVAIGPDDAARRRAQAVTAQAESLSVR